MKKKTKNLLIDIVLFPAVYMAIALAWLALLDCASAQGIYPIQQKVIHLPEDGGKWHLSLIGQLNSSQCREVDKWLKESEQMKTFMQSVHYHPVDTSTAIYKERYAQSLQAVPAIRLQDSKGKVVYESSLDSIPYTSKGLYRAFYNSIEQYRRKCPLRPSPEPDTTPVPVLVPVPDVPPVIPEPDDLITESQRLLLVIACVAVAVGFGIGWYKHYNTNGK